MRARNHRRLVLVMLSLLAGDVVLAQDKAASYEEELHAGDAYLQRRDYEQALRYYTHAYALRNKASYDALVGMVMAYNGLAAYKDAFGMCAQGLKLAGEENARQARVHNLCGVALVGLADKPGDKKYRQAETEFRSALEADGSHAAARLNLGVTLLRMNRDDEGVRELKAYVENAPPGPDLESARRMIEDPRRARESFAPAFTFTSSEGEQIDLEELRGKTVLLDFWGSWCIPCVRATPGLIRLRRKLAGQPVVFLGIAQDQDASWKRYLERNNMDWPQYLDSSGKILRLYGVKGFPTYVVLDGEGIVRARRSGYGSDTDGWLEREIRKTLASTR